MIDMCAYSVEEIGFWKTDKDVTFDIIYNLRP